MVTPPSPVHGIFADDGSATRALLLAYGGSFLAVVAAILALRDVRLALLIASGAAVAGAAFFLLSRGRKLFTSSTLWIVDHETEYRFSIELNLKRPPQEPVGVIGAGKPLTPEPAKVVCRGDTWLVVFDVKKNEAPRGRLAITLLELHGGRRLARFSVSMPA